VDYRCLSVSHSGQDSTPLQPEICPTFGACSQWTNFDF
jgi:hypothetical protein